MSYSGSDVASKRDAIEAAQAPGLWCETLQYLSTAVLIFNCDLCLLTMNPAAESLLGSSRGHAAGQTLSELLPEGKQLTKNLGNAQHDGRGYAERELELLLPGGGRKIVDWVVTLFPNGVSGEHVLLEVTELNRPRRIVREEQFIRQGERLRALLREMAHEIKNPLSGIKGAAQLLEQELEAPKWQEYTQVISHEVDRLQGLVDRVAGPQGQFKPRTLNIHEVTERVYLLIGAESPHGVQVERDYDPSIPELHADPELLIQALLNIARNAVQAVGEQGRIILRTRILRKFTLGRRHYPLVASIEVEDDGPGVPDAYRETLFFPLVTGRVDGSGLGLALAQSVAQRHGGLVEYRSDELKTVFSILLPIGNTA